jgi:hypothetical protein
MDVKSTLLNGVI